MSPMCDGDPRFCCRGNHNRYISRIQLYLCQWCSYVTAQIKSRPLLTFALFPSSSLSVPYVLFPYNKPLSHGTVLALCELSRWVAILTQVPCNLQFFLVRCSYSTSSHGSLLYPISFLLSLPLSTNPSQDYQDQPISIYCWITVIIILLTS